MSVFGSVFPLHPVVIFHRDLVLKFRPHAAHEDRDGGRVLHELFFRACACALPALCERVFAMSRGSELWLLTNDAANHFALHGFVVLPRASAPAAIAASKQFASLCPALAHLMYRR